MIWESGAAASAALPVSPVEDEQGPTGRWSRGRRYLFWGRFFASECRTSDDWDEEVDETDGFRCSDDPGTSACASEKKSVRGAAAAAALPVKQVTAEVRRVTLKRSSVSLENRGSKKRKSRENECKIMPRRYVHFHSSETSRGATSPAMVRGA